MTFVKNILSQCNISIDEIAASYLQQIVMDDSDEPEWDEVYDFLLLHWSCEHQVIQCINMMKDCRRQVMCATKTKTDVPQEPIALVKRDVKRVDPKPSYIIDPAIKSAILSKYDLTKTNEKPLKQVRTSDVEYFNQPKKIKRRYLNNSVVTDKGDKYVSFT